MALLVIGAAIGRPVLARFKGLNGAQGRFASGFGRHLIFARTFRSDGNIAAILRHASLLLHAIVLQKLALRRLDRFGSLFLRHGSVTHAPRQKETGNSQSGNRRMGFAAM